MKNTILILLVPVVFSAGCIRKQRVLIEQRDQQGLQQTGNSGGGNGSTVASGPSGSSESDANSNRPAPSGNPDQVNNIPPKPQPNPSTAETPANAEGTLEVNGTSILLQDMKLTIPEGWTLHQDADQDGILILAFAHDEKYFRIYVKKGDLPEMRATFANGSKIIKDERVEHIGSLDWRRIDTAMDGVSISAFAATYKGHVYYGLGRASSQQPAENTVREFLALLK